MNKPDNSEPRQCVNNPLDDYKREEHAVIDESDLLLELPDERGEGELAAPPASVPDERPHDVIYVKDAVTSEMRPVYVPTLDDDKLTDERQGCRECGNHDYHSFTCDYAETVMTPVKDSERSEPVESGLHGAGDIYKATNEFWTEPEQGAELPPKSKLSRVDEARERMARGVRVFRPDIVGDLCNEIDALAARVPATQPGDAQAMKSAMLARLWEVQSDRAHDETPEETMKLDALLSIVATELEKVPLPPATQGDVVDRTSGIPEGAKPVDAYLMLNGQLVVCGEPPDEPEDLTPEEYAAYYETSHNCDQMGCGLSHVLYRFDTTAQVVDRASVLEEAARAICSVCKTVYETPAKILCGPAKLTSGAWAHWLIEGEHKGKFAGHCQANAIRLLSTPAPEEK